MSLKIFDHRRRGSKFGLVRDPAQATTFANKISATMSAGRAEAIIMRSFHVVELGSLPLCEFTPAKTGPPVGDGKSLTRIDEFITV